MDYRVEIVYVSSSTPGTAPRSSSHCRQPFRLADHAGLQQQIEDYWPRLSVGPGTSTLADLCSTQRPHAPPAATHLHSVTRACSNVSESRLITSINLQEAANRLTTVMPHFCDRFHYFRPKFTCLNKAAVDWDSAEAVDHPRPRPRDAMIARFMLSSCVCPVPRSRSRRPLGTRQPLRTCAI